MSTVSDAFVRHRSLLFTVAYEMLGSAADAEDVVQETWLRWDAVGPDGRAEIRHPRAYLVRMVTRQALNRMRTISRQREDYVGEWLPEPLLTTPDVADDVELAESVSIAMLTVLETLAPAERAVFVLREVFEVPHAEIAEALGKTPAAVRQIARRARAHVDARRPLMQPDTTGQRELLERTVAAMRAGDADALVELLAPDVVMIADGGGIASARLTPVHGAKTAAKLLSKLSQYTPDFITRLTTINGSPALVLEVEGEWPTVMTVAVHEGKITRIYGMRNPEKLTRVERETPLSR
ncbi:RNA polymerase sigma-70 factor [Ruania alba]|uniref:RNA polymerase sigma-70 factor, ECF subfamily n=1 Tax=Ruania alba TaxID=648782 RepID=A0A1H5LA83_9MICO|nr:RNA polymerase sigma-70 factor [Ruania alba]SEE73953.1 RNA polymerase sigma-70 factor, ECF subfamily [Ruania alba]